MSVISYMDNLSSKLILKGTEKDNIDRSISTLKQRLNYHFDSIEKTFIFGSYIRGTILPRKADSKSDIDYMIVFENSNDYMPQTYLNRLKMFAEKYYSTSEIFQSSPTVVLNLNHIKFELVPAYSYNIFWNEKYYIPAPASDYIKWIETNPNGFNNELIKKNQNENYKIKPMIRLAKYWNTLNGHFYSSYLLEKYIIDMYYDYYNTSIKDYFFEFALGLQTSHLGKTNSNKVNKLKERIIEVKHLQEQGEELLAEIKIRQILTDIS